MSIKYCGIFEDNKDFKCLGESDIIKFKKFITKEKASILHEPLSRHITLNMGFGLTILKFGEKKVICCVEQSAKYNIVKKFLQIVIDNITKLHNRLERYPAEVVMFEEYSKIINSKMDLSDISTGEGEKTKINLQKKNSVTTRNDHSGITFGTSNMSKHGFYKEKQIEKLRKSATKQIDDVIDEEEGETGNKKTQTFRSCQTNVVANKKHFRTAKNPPISNVSKNKDNLINIINEDVNELKDQTKKNIYKVIKNQEDLSELLVKSKQLNTSAMAYEDTTVELKKETKKMLLFWSAMVCCCSFGLIWVVVSEILCGSFISPFCVV
jgi:hypothetical protein